MDWPHHHIDNTLASKLFSNFHWEAIRSITGMAAFSHPPCTFTFHKMKCRQTDKYESNHYHHPHECFVSVEFLLFLYFLYFYVPRSSHHPCQVFTICLVEKNLIKPDEKNLTNLFHHIILAKCLLCAWWEKNMLKT